MMKALDEIYKIQSCRSRQELSNEYLVFTRKIGFGTAENRSIKVCQQLAKTQRKNLEQTQAIANFANETHTLWKQGSGEENDDNDNESETPEEAMSPTVVDVPLVQRARVDFMI